MPHLITIIKYARNIVKYSLVPLSALFERRLASFGERYKWFLLFGLPSIMGSFGNLCHGRPRSGRDRPEACPTLSYSTGEGVAPDAGDIK
jgi:hypothetical protein